MGNITLEQVDLVIQRAHVSYSEAKEALEHCNGDVVEALLYLEQRDKVQPARNISLTDNLTSFINKLNAITFILKKKERIYVNVPLSIALLAIILCFHVSILALLTAVIFGVRVRIIDGNEDSDIIDSTIDKFKK